MSNIINTSEPEAKSRFTRKGVVVIVVVALAVIAGLGYLSQKPGFWQGKQQASQNKTDKAPDYNSLVVGINKDNYQDAIKQLDTQTAQAKDDKARAAIYVQKASLALTVQSYDDALQFAKQAEQLDPSASVIAVVAKCAEAKGDKELAITYYKKAISKLNPNTENGKGDIDIYTAAIKNLGGTP